MDILVYSPNSDDYIIGWQFWDYTILYNAFLYVSTCELILQYVICILYIIDITIDNIILLSICIIWKVFKKSRYINGKRGKSI